MSKKLDQVKERLRKILAIAKGNGNPHERDMAMARLQEQLIKHRLDIQDIEPESDIAITHVEGIGPNGPWARRVSQSIATLNFCQYLYGPYGHDRQKIRHKFVGLQHEAEIARDLAMLIMEQLKKEAALQGRLNGNPSFQRSFLNGAADAILHRVIELKAASTTPSERTPNALIVLSEYALAAVRNDEYVSNTFKNVAIVKSKTKAFNDEGRTEGQKFGMKIPLRTTMKIG